MLVGDCGNRKNKSNEFEELKWQQQHKTMPALVADWRR